MSLKRLLVLAATVTALVSAATTSTLVSAGTAGASTPAALKSTVAKDALVARSGAVVSPKAAMAMAGRAANVQGHNGFVPARTSTVPTTVRPGVRPTSIIGADNRIQVTATTSFPNSAVVLIERNGGLWCTGWMVGKDTLLSAGHCVTDGAGTWYGGLTFLPGSNGGTAPFGTCTARTIYAFSAWAFSADANYDASIVKLNCTVGYSTGWFGTWWQSASPNGLSTVVQGYPGDKPSTQWEAFDSVRSSTADRLSYQNDTTGGESGSPVWQYRLNQPWCDGQCAMGIHTNGSDGTNNSGVRFTQAKLNAIYAIVNQA